MSNLGSVELPLRVAIVGSGPSGFYAAESIFKSGLSVTVAMFDRLPTPHGLVRGGVAPDHPKIKSVSRVFDRIASNPAFSFLGNVTIGRDIQIEDLRSSFDCTILAYGAESDNRLGIPGEDLMGSHAATEFVGWYNGHPDYRDRAFDLSCEVAVVIGQGNVAMDVTRILAKTPEELRDTDIADFALDALAESRIREIHLIGRRGPVQAKFTAPELKELNELADCDTVTRLENLKLDEASTAELADANNLHAQKNFEIIRSYAHAPDSAKRKRCHIEFLKSPIELRGDGKVERIVLERNRLEGEPFKTRAIGTGALEELNCGIVFRSVGYRGTAIPGVPFDERRGTIPNVAGRVQNGTSAVPGLYVAGWIKRGPSGVIGTNKPDSQETVASLISDVPSLTPCPDRDTSALILKLKTNGVRPISFVDWQRIDAAEVERGKASGKPREKFAKISEMLDILK